MAFVSNQLLLAEYEYDFAVDGGATGVHDLSAKANKADLPVGCLRKSTHVMVQTALAGVGASAKIGTSASDADLAALAAIASWSASAIFNDATAIYVGTTNRDCILTISGAPLTAGKLKVFIEYIVPTT